MGRPRETDQMMTCPTHASGMKDCFVMTASAVHTIELKAGHFACLVHDTPGLKFGMCSVLDRDEVETLILFLRNAIEDAERLDAGKAPLHAAPSLVRQ